MRQVAVDVAVVGAGGAGLTVLHELALAAAGGERRWRVALVDDVDRLSARPDDRTWCFWDRGRNLADPALSATWRRVAVESPSGRQVLDLEPLRYAMLRAADYYALVDGAVRAAGPRLDLLRLPAATSVLDGSSAPDDTTAGDAVVRTAAGDVSARWVLDSRPQPPARPPVTALLQDFRGVVVRTGRDAFDPELPLLMDFRTAQPEHGLSFGYCLPLGPRRALVEYTEFSRAPVDELDATAALDTYLRLLVAAGTSWTVEHAEHGRIPMTDARYARRAGRRVMRIGTAGGATRPATGYAFRTMQRQARGIVAALIAGREPIPPRPYPRRHLLMDAALLRGLDAGHLDGPVFFTRLFARNPPARVLDLLDGASGPASEMALMSTTPAGAMLRAGAEAVLLRARGRLPATERLPG